MKLLDYCQYNSEIISIKMLDNQCKHLFLNAEANIENVIIEFSATGKDMIMQKNMEMIPQSAIFALWNALWKNWSY
jgi:hypothetical protein